MLILLFSGLSYLLILSLVRNNFWIFLSPLLVYIAYHTILAFFDVTVWNMKKETNTSQKSIELFIDQISKTRKSLKIFDDGNYMNKGAYNNESVMTALANKLENNDFKIDIHFNCRPNKSKIFALAKEYENIKIKHNPDFDEEKRNKNEIHFRISDDDKFCHISQHKFGEEKRAYISCKKTVWHNVCFSLRSEEEYKNHPIISSKNIFKKQENIFEELKKNPC